MCQLLGMNCAAPTDFTFSLKGFCRRGGETDKHSHGWGCAIYEGRGGLRCFHDTLPAAVSPIAQLVQDHRIRTYNMMAHIRYATQGPVSLENVHPFTRELWGIQWTFAHNGDCAKFSNIRSVEDMPVLGQTEEAAALNSNSSSRCYHPVGDTDSEAVFCAILNAIKAKFSPLGGLPTLSALHEFLQELCREIVNDDNDTIFNFLLGCGQYTLFAYSWPGSRPGSTVWNGLHYIVRESAPFSTDTLLDDGNNGVDDDNYSTTTRTVATNSNHRVAVITTKPLTREPGWCEMKRGELIMFDHGRPHRTAACCETVEQQGRGLCSKVFENFPKTIRRSRSSSSITSSTSSSSSNNSSSSSNDSNKCDLQHHGGPSLPMHHQQYQEQTQVNDSDDISSSSTIKSDIENTFNSSGAAVDVTISAIAVCEHETDWVRPQCPRPANKRLHITLS